MRSKLVITTSILALLYLATGNESLLQDQQDLAHFLQINDQQYNELDATFENLKGYNFSCQYLADFAIYNLTPLAEFPWYTVDSGLTTYFFSFCAPISSFSFSCGASTMFTQAEGTSCNVLSGGDPSGDIEASFVNNTGDAHLVLSYSGGSSKCTDLVGNTQDYEPSIVIYCSENNQLIEKLSVDDSNFCQPIIIFSSTAGCSEQSLNAFWQWIEQFKWAIFAIFVGVGFFVCFFGRRLFKPVMFIAGVVLSLALVWVIFYKTFLSDNTDGWVGWVVLIGGLVLGLLVGCLFIKLVYLGAFILAAWGGFTLALLLYNTFLYLAMSTTGLWVFAIATALVCGALAIFFVDHILIMATALAGSFLFIEGIGVVAGGYQNPFTLAYERSEGITDTIDPIFYAYLAGNVVLCGLGLLFQYKQRKDGHHFTHPYEK